MKRRDFIRSTGAMSLACMAGLGTLSACVNHTKGPINKRDAMLALIEGSKTQDYYPGSFFMHFGEGNLFGESAIKKHLDYFRAADFDFLKVQYERKFPLIPEIQKPSDWNKVPLLGKDFYEEQLKVIEGVIKGGKKDALVIATVYSPLSFAGHVTGYKHHINHLNEDPEAVKIGLDAITESTLIFVRECMKLGVDGFFQATQGGEFNRFKHDNIFNDYIKPLDLIISNEIDECECNVLHIHAGDGKYVDYSNFVDYPSHIINCGLELHDKTISTKDLYNRFNRPIMSGLERKGILTTGTESEIITKVNRVLKDAPDQFILGATCTIPTDTNWNKIRVAMDTAHGFSR